MNLLKESLIFQIEKLENLEQNERKEQIKLLIARD